MGYNCCLCCCCWWKADQYLVYFRYRIYLHLLPCFYCYSLDIYKSVKMGKSPKEKTIYKAMRSADKFYNEVPGKYSTFCFREICNIYNCSIWWCVWWRDVVPILLCVCLLYNCLCLYIIKVCILLPWIHFLRQII